MKVLALLGRARCLGPLLLGTFLLIGCSTTKTVEWNSRIGSYTYDQAILEFGPPDKQAKLSDGQTVAAWIVRRSGGSGLTLGTGFYGSSGGVGLSQSVGSGLTDRSLTLTFGTDGRLSNWSKDH